MSQTELTLDAYNQPFRMIAFL